MFHGLSRSTKITQQCVRNGSVLIFDCMDGARLAALSPSRGVGIVRDEKQKKEQSALFSHYEFYTFDERAQITGAFDYIILNTVLASAENVISFLTDLKRLCAPHTRLVIDAYPSWCSWFIRLSSMFRFDARTTFFTRKDLKKIAPIINLHIVRCMRTSVIARFVQHHTPDVTVSVIITCKNERGNIAAAVARTPMMGKHTELLFVEGNSTDGTNQEIERVIQGNPHRDIRLITQRGRGKGDAVRAGFAAAHGDILMILDGDLTVRPEDLPLFFDALMRGKGELINGVRLLYPMEKEAMTRLSFLANYGLSFFVSAATGQAVSDSLCGTKVLFKRDYEHIAANRSRLGLADPFGDYDLLFGAAYIHRAILDLPVRYYKRTYGTTNISRFYDVWFLLWMCVRAWWIIRF